MQAPRVAVQVFLLIFLLLVTIALSNLIIGLSVNQAQEVYSNARAVKPLRMLKQVRIYGRNCLLYLSVLKAMYI